MTKPIMDRLLACILMYLLLWAIVQTVQIRQLGQRTHQAALKTRQLAAEQQALMDKLRSREEQKPEPQQHPIFTQAKKLPCRPSCKSIHITSAKAMAWTTI